MSIWTKIAFAVLVLLVLLYALWETFVPAPKDRKKDPHEDGPVT